MKFTRGFSANVGQFSQGAAGPDAIETDLDNLGKILDGAQVGVQAENMADGSVTTPKVADSSITNVKLGNDIQASKINITKVLAYISTTVQNLFTEIGQDLAETKLKLDLIFNRVYPQMQSEFDFDNWARRNGYTYTHEKTTDNTTTLVWTEYIKKISDGTIFATRVNTKTKSTGVWVTRVTCSSLQIDTTITYSKDVNGKWTGVVS